MGFFTGTAYFIGIPLVFVILLWEIKNEKTYLRFVKKEKMDQDNRKYGYTDKGLEMIREKNLKDYKDSLKRLKRLQIYTMIAMLILLPTWNFAAAEHAYSNIHTERVGPMGIYSTPLDPVVYQVGPTFNVEFVKEQIEKEPDKYRPDLIDDVVDLDKLTRIPGELGIYRLQGEKIVITYAYVSPYPIMKTYVFRFLESPKGQDPIYEQTSHTIIYPMNPADASKLEEL